jgi:hypothetical protein
MEEIVLHAYNTLTITSGANEVLIVKPLPILPVEIWEIILYNLHEYEEYLVVLVCKEWYDIMDRRAQLRAKAEGRKRDGKGETRWCTAVGRAFASPTLIEWAMSVSPECPFFTGTDRLKTLAAGGHPSLCIDQLKEICYHSQKVIRRELLRSFVIILAKHGHFQVFAQLHQDHPDLWHANFDQEVIDCIGTHATTSRNLQFIEWLHKLGSVFTSRSYTNAIVSKRRTGPLYRVIELLIEIKCPKDPHCVAEALRQGDIRMIKFLVDKGFLVQENNQKEMVPVPLSEYMYQCAVVSKSLECLDYLFSLREEHGCPLSQHILNIAIRWTNINVVKWLLDHQCPIEEDVCDTAASVGSIEMMSLFHMNGGHLNENTMISAAEYNHLNAVKWLRENGCNYTEEVSEAAARGGSIKLLSYLHAQGCPFDWTAACGAAKFGNLHALQWLIEKGYACNGAAINAAANWGELQVVQWLIDQGYPCDKTTTHAAASGGELEVLQFLLERGCEQEQIAIAATEEGHLHILVYLWDLSCDHEAFGFHNSLINLAQANNFDNIVEWLTARGYKAEDEY